MCKSRKLVTDSNDAAKVFWIGSTCLAISAWAFFDIWTAVGVFFLPVGVTAMVGVVAWVLEGRSDA